MDKESPYLVVFLGEGPRDGVDGPVEVVHAQLVLGKEFGEGILGLLNEVSLHLDDLFIAL